MMDTTLSSNQHILYSTLGGLQPGGTCLSWIAGLTVCEALRLTQRFDVNTSKPRRFFVYFGLVITISMAGLLAALLYHYCVLNYGNYQLLTSMVNVGRVHFVVGRIATMGGFVFYSHVLWTSALGKTKILQIPLVKIIIPLINLLLFAFYIIVSVRMLSSTTLEASRKPWSLSNLGPHVQFGCGAALTLLQVVDLAKSDAVRKMLVYKGDYSRYASSLLCLLCQTAILPTIFDLIILSMPEGKAPGIGYTLLSLSAHFHIFGPIIAISAALDSNSLNDRASTCSVARHDYDGENAKMMKRLTFQQPERILVS